MGIRDLLSAGLMSLLPASAALGAVTIVGPADREHDTGYALAMEDAAGALRSSGHDASIRWLPPSAPLPEGDLILVGRPAQAAAQPWLPDKPEGFRIRPMPLSDRRVVAVEGDEPGLMYGLFKLAERVRLGEDAWSIATEQSPAFPLRFFSEEGQLLDIPDMAYYTDKPPYVNEERLRRETGELKELVDHVVRLGYNTLVVLHLSFEEYVDYRYLRKPVYPPDDPHRLRSPVFCRHLTELCDYAHARHVDVYLQLYELQFPPEMDTLYDVSLNSADMEKIIRAKVRELFERVPLDGLYITATEAHPRCGYRSRQIWRPQGRSGAAKMLTMFTEACSDMDKRAVFRLWRIASDAAGAREVTTNVPDDAMLSIKNTGGDFFFSSPTTSVITRGVSKEQPFVVIFDTFREFDGWSRLFCFMKRWGPTVRDCRDNEVVGINAWGPWSEGCIFPDWEPGYLRDLEGQPQTQKVSWAGFWNQFRMFTRGFTPGQANAYLLARLAWEPDADVEEIARDFAALNLGPANAEAGGDALMATQDAFQEEYVRGTHPVYIKWTMTFGPREDRLEEAYQKNPLETVLAANARALAAVERMEAAFARTDRAKAPDPARYDQFKEGVEKTALYLRTFYGWREGWWRRRAARELEGEAKKANAEALVGVKQQLDECFAEWKRFPEEAGYWRITYRYGKPQKGSSDTFTYWYPRGDVTMESTAREF